jgi:hypothetical protein
MARSAALLACVFFSGCAAVGGIFSSGGSEQAPAPPSVGGVRPSLGAGLGLYLETLSGLLEGDAVTQVDVFRNAAAAMDVAPTTTNRLNLAIALATPGHPSSDASQAQQLLSQLVAAGDALLPEERILALLF